MARLSTYSLDASAHLIGNGHVLIGGSPLKVFRLTPAGAKIIEDISKSQPVPTNSLINRLVEAGAIHPQPHAQSPTSIPPDQVSVVIPAYRATRFDLQRLTKQLGDVAQVIIVDDASTPAIPAINGATVIRRARNGGPGQARMTGLDVVNTPFVAFVDTDIEIPPDWLTPLLAHFDDPRVAAVAPRVASQAGTSLIERFEQSHGALDLGAEVARVQPGTRVSYVPSAVLVCRVEHVRKVGGFDPALRVGEDVDLVWRLVADGLRVRYEPGVVVHHRTRANLAKWAKQRFVYGTSAADLEQRHPGTLAPLRLDRTSGLVWLVALIGFPLIAAAGAGVTVYGLVRKLRAIPDGTREAIRLAGRGHLYAGRSIASAATRAWWPLSLGAALLSRRARLLFGLATIVPNALDWVRLRPRFNPLAYMSLRVLDDAAYGAGVWVGCWRKKSWKSLLPQFSRFE